MGPRHVGLFQRGYELLSSREGYSHALPPFVTALTALTPIARWEISEEFWERKTGELRTKEQPIKLAIESLGSAHAGSRALLAEQAFELANNA